jgi:hypothetical protein
MAFYGGGFGMPGMYPGMYPGMGMPTQVLALPVSPPACARHAS